MALSPDPLAVGKYVTIDDSPGALTWRIAAVYKDATANGPLYTLESGQTGRRRYVAAHEITPYLRITE